MTDEGADPSDAADVDGRVVEFLRTAERPRHLASDVSAALDLPRGRIRTRLQALADDGRVVRIDAERTARWAVPDRADEPEPEPESDPEHAAGDEVEEDVDGDAGEPGAAARGGADSGIGENPDGSGGSGMGDAIEDEDPAADRGVEDTDRARDEAGSGNGGRTGDRDGTDTPATVRGPAGLPDRPTDDAPPGSPSAASVERARRWRGPAGRLALFVGLAVALVALERLRRR